MDEYLKTIPPLPRYGSTLPLPTSTIPPRVRYPQSIIHWPSFGDEVLSFVQSDIVPITGRVERPVFELLEARIRSEVPTLQMFISQNLFQVVATHRGCDVMTTEYGQSAGATDSHIEKNGIPVIINEYKGKWILNPDWFQDGGRIDGQNVNIHIQRAINQVYTYTVANRLEYGILTSCDSTFFLKRVKIENDLDGVEQLLISSCISHDSVSPTILQSIAYFMSIADGSRISSPPLSSSSSSSSYQQSSISFNPSSGSDCDLDLSTSSQSSNYLPGSSGSSFNSKGAKKGVSKSKEVDFCLEDFKIDYVLGYGRTKVYYEAKNQLALKAIDLFKHADMIPELENEIEIYECLIDLQGAMIPKLLLHGYWEGGMYCIGLSLCGTVPETLSNSQKRKVMEIIHAIHSNGILHNDIKKENILVDEDGTVRLIDFAFATRNNCRIAQKKENARLRKCIELL
jgi:hypothetical protein